MKERPILFSGSMVRALLDGSKTQTRRASKQHQTDARRYVNPDGTPRTDMPCPYGQPGDRLWVRETWGVISHTWNDNGDMVDWIPNRLATAIHEMPFGNGYYNGHVIYAADGQYEWAGDDDGGGEPRSAWKPSIHMPRVASRITLEITGVRVERLQDISYEDAIAEGMFDASCAAPFPPSLNRSETPEQYARRVGRPQREFADLWESINGAGSWDTNTWVWVVEFKRIKP